MILIRKLNYRNIRLSSLYTAECIGVRCRDGALRYLPFLGFAERGDAIAAKAQPVLLDVYGYYQDNDCDSCLTVLDPTEWVQGAAVRLGVYALTERHQLRVVQHTPRTAIDS